MFSETRTFRRLDAVRQDVAFAVRMLRKTPGFSTVAILSLAIGIGASSAIFSVVNGVLLKALPYPHAERLVSVWEKRPDGERSAMSTLNYLDYAKQGSVFEHLAATTGCCGYVMLGGGAAPARLTALRVSATYFDVLGTEAAIGRTFVPGDDQQGRDHVVVLSHRVWSSRFGSDQALIGRPIRLDGQPYTVVGVMPQGGPFQHARTDIWLPLSFPPERMNRSSHWLLTISGGALGRLKPGVTVEQARAELETIASRLSAEYPASNKGWSAAVEPYVSVIVGKDLLRSLYLLLGAIGMVLFIGCVNLANVMLARALARQREIAVRSALGAGRGRLVQQLLTESLALAACGGVFGVIVAYAIVAALNAAVAALPLTMATLPIVFPPEASIELDWRVLSFTLLVSMASGMAFGLVPAVCGPRGIGGAPGAAWPGARVTPVHHRLRSALVVTEVALAFALLAGAGLLIRSVVSMRAADLGFEAGNLVTAEIPVRDHRFATAGELRGFIRQVTDTIEALPGVSAVAFTDSMPLQGTPTLTFFQLAGQPRVERSQRPTAPFKVVSPSYSRALGLRLSRGRWLSEFDRDETSRVAVINATMARMYFPDADPVGRHLIMSQPGLGFVLLGEETPWEIVGVIADERLVPFDDQEPHPAVYVSNLQSPTPFAGVVVRTSVDPSGMGEALRRSVAAIDADQPVTDVKTVGQLEDESLLPDRLRSWLVGVFAAIALLLASAGIYGVVAFLVAQRTHELGIRAALGATPASLVTLVVVPGAVYAGLGLALGCVLAYGVTRLLGSFLFGVRPSDAITFLGTAGVLAVVAIVACYLPARRAARANPIEAVRAE
jgi:putative ABC transport system permease protein